MATYWNDLKVLKDISKNIEENVENSTDYNDNDVADFKEGLQYFIEEWITSNIKLYKEYDFEDIIYESLYNISCTYYFIN